MSEPEANNGALSEAIEGRHPPGLRRDGSVGVGVLRGEGAGPEVVAAAVSVLEAVCGAKGLKLELSEGPAFPAGAADGDLSEATAEFCRDTFAAGGAVLAGAHGGRWVYELRRRFDLFCKLSPLRPPPELGRVAGPISPSELDDVDLLVVREQSGGVYQGRWGELETREQGRVAEHSFSYGQRQVRRIISVAAALARRRSGRLAVIVKDGGVPSISRVWRGCAAEIGGDEPPLIEVMDIDYAVYKLLRAPQELDVIVAPNLFGDIICDAGGVLLGSRGNSFGASFDSGQAAVYQTNHGAAHDLAGRDLANPAGQILAAALMLRESFALGHEAELMERALGAAWREGFRTADVEEPGCRVVGTREMGERVAQRVADLARASASRTAGAERP